MNFSSLISYNFWTSIPDVTSGAGRVVFALTLGLFFLGIVIRIVNARKKTDRHIGRMFSRVGSLCVTVGLLGTILAFMSYENVPFFGNRFWYAALFILAIVWAVRIVVFLKKRLPEIREQERLDRERNKYLPGRS